MAKEKAPEYYQDFIRTIEAREKERAVRRQKKILLSSVLLIFYLFIAGFLLIWSKNFSSFPIFNFGQNQSIKELNSKVEALENKVNAFTSSTQTDLSFNDLNSRIASIEQKNSYLYDTILSSPDSAITPKILREEQANINEKIQDLKSQVDKMNTLLLGLIITGGLGIGGYILKQVWGGIVSKKNSIKE